MLERLPLPEELPAEGFSTVAALDAGLSRTRLRSAELARPHHGARAALPPEGHLEQARAFAPLLREHFAFSGISAAAIYGLPFRSQQRDVQVLAGDTVSRIRREGVQLRRIEATMIDTWFVDGMRVTAPALTWALLGRELSSRELVVVGDAIVSDANNYPGKRISGQLATLDELAAITAAFQGKQGSGALRKALPLIRERVESPQETRHRLVMVQAGIPEPEIQVSHYDSRTGTLIGRSDMFHRDARIAHEYEGDHHRERDQWNHDLEKYRRLEREGILVMRVTARDLHPDPRAYLHRLRQALADRTPRK